ncbi:MAG TPA: hypothetical protein VFG60_05285 [Burkholderiaceae bacterium]|nr:hypothetical protein [Burkholderiaceae bacterium]
MKRSSLTLAIATLTLGLGAPGAVLAQSTAPKQAPVATAVTGPVIAGTTTAITGKVTRIDRDERMVVVRDKNGKMATVKVGANVPNFDTIDMGDTVTMRYTEAVSLAIAKGGLGTDAQLGEIRTKVQADAAAKAKDGMPGMATMEQATLVANVFQIDRKRGVLTLRGTDGVPVSIKVPDKTALAAIKLDDQVVIGYLQAAAVSIEPGTRS